MSYPADRGWRNVDPPQVNTEIRTFVIHLISALWKSSLVIAVCRHEEAMFFCTHKKALVRLSPPFCSATQRAFLCSNLNLKQKFTP